MLQFQLIAPQVPTKYPNEVRLAAVSFDEVLESGETFTGTPTITEVTTSALTLANKAVSTGSLTILDRTVAIGRALVFSISGGSAGTSYKIKLSCGTTGGTVAQTIIRFVQLNVVAEPT